MRFPFKTTTALAVALAASGSCWATEGAADGAKLLTPNLGTIFWTAVTFVLLMLLLRKVAWGPLLGAIDAREKSIRDQFDQARKDREQAESMVNEHRELLTAARRERAEAVDRGKRDAERVKAEILDEAKKQREQILKDSQAQVDAGVRKAREELRRSTVDLAILAAERLLSRTIDDASQRQLVEEHLADLERRSGDASSLPS